MKKAFSRKNLWQQLPCSIKTVFGLFLRFTSPESLLGRRFRDHLQYLNKIQRRSLQWNQAGQLAQLKYVCTLAGKQSSFYRRWFHDAGFDPARMKSLDDLSKLPTIDKQTVMENLDQMCTLEPHASNVDYVSTGGTSGQPLRFYMGSGRSSIEYAYLIASWRRIGYRLDLPMAVFRGHVVPQNRSGLHHQYDPLLRHHYYSSFHMTDENIERYLNHLRTIGPCFLHVYPSSVDALARFIHRSGVQPPHNVCGIIAESEIVYPEQRKLAQEVFGCRYFSCYGHTEKLVLAAECEYTDYYHVWPTYGYFELLDDVGRPITTPGQRGEITGTGFLDTVVPFIRYRTGDYATYIADHCDACGRKHTLITDICGHRIQETLVTRDGAEIPWTAMNMHDDTFDHVRQFQFYQDTPGFGILRIVPAGEFSDEDQRRILRNLSRKFDGRFDFTLELKSEIPLSPRGKAIYVDQKIPHR